MKAFTSLFALTVFAGFAGGSEPPAVKNPPPVKKFVVPIPPDATPVATDPRAASVQVESRKGYGSGVCIASEGGKSLILSNNHVFAPQSGPGARFALAPYPMGATVHKLDKKYEGWAVAGCDQADLALVVVDGTLPVAELADADAKIGAAVHHYGYGSGGSEGVVRVPPQRIETPEYWFSSTCASKSGDSGAGVFDAQGRVVAIHNGGGGGGTYGAPVSEIVLVLKEKAPGAFPRLRERIKARKVLVVAVPAAPDAPKAKAACPNCSTCGTNCACPGSPLNCADGKCLPAAKAPVAPATTAPGTVRTASGNLIRPNGRGGWEYVGESATAAPLVSPFARPSGAPGCAGGNCPLPSGPFRR